MSRLEHIAEDARVALETPELVGPEEALAGMTPVLRMWRYPVFRDHQSWTVYRGPAARPFAVRRVTWRRNVDSRYGELMTGDADVWASDADLPADATRALLEEGAQLLVPEEHGDWHGLDGETVGVIWLSGREGRWEWWCEGPLEWRNLDAWVGRLRELCERLLG